MAIKAKKEQFSFDENGHLTNEASALMVEAMLQGKISIVSENILEHLENCKECKDNIMDMVVFLRNPDSAAQLKRTLRKKFKPKSNWHFYRGKIAAIFVSIALLVGTYFLIVKNPKFMNRIQSDTAESHVQHKHIQPKQIAKNNPGLNKQKENPSHLIKNSNKIQSNGDQSKNNRLLSSRYQVNPNLENMIGSRVRSGFFEVIGPENGSVLKNQILFSWKKDLDKSHTLNIVDNKNSILFTYPVKGTSFTFQETLAPGLYYWKLESQNELLYVGKFFTGGQGNL